ncbi:MAG: hypothetical protein WA017_05475 [Desulfosalsimonadaceae bacterium]
MKTPDRIRKRTQLDINGLNGVGIPDLIIAQNAMQHQSHIYSLDSHFRHMQDILNIQLIG